MVILGISAFYHDSAAALVVDGEIVAAAQEERFTRKKHDSGFPCHAVEYCLQQANLTPQQIDYVAFYEKPLKRFERLIETWLAFVPRGYRAFRLALPEWLRTKLHLPREIRNGLRSRSNDADFGKLKETTSAKFVFVEHHESHAASAFFPSPFEEAAILTLDGVGEWATTTMGTARGNEIELSDEIRFPHSLGLLYSAFTYFCGFRVNSGEYKLMGLAPYGEPVYRDLILDHLITVKADGSFFLHQQYFNYCAGLTMTSERFNRLIGGPPRQPESELTEREMNLAASVQVVTEEIMLRMANSLYERTGLTNLVMAGGVALNCVGNGKVLREGPFENIWIQPAAGDAGGALGAALFVWHQLLKRPRVTSLPDGQQASRLGPSFDDEQIETMLAKAGGIAERTGSDEELCSRVSELLAEEQVVGWFQGRMEFGPRALGSRSILGDPRSPEMQSVMNLKIKFRESFRPFAPIVLAEHAPSYFDLESHDSPYMLIVANVSDAHLVTPEQHVTTTGLDQRHVVRSSIPAVTHVDNSARVQTVDRQRDPLLTRLLEAFHERTGCPVLINTSFNVRSEPIVCTPEDAFRCFMMTDMDVLVLGRHVLLKSAQPDQMTDADRKRHLDQFALD